MWPVILLFMVGVTLIFSEFFLPGAVLGIIGGLLIIGSAVLGWYRYPDYGPFILGGELVGVIACVGLGLYIVTSTGVKNVIVLNSQQQTSEGYTSPAEDPELVGRLATVDTALRPAGSILVDDRRIDAVSDGTFIDSGKTVRVIEVEGHRVVCEEATEEETTA